MTELTLEEFRFVRDRTKERSGIWLSEIKVNFLSIRLSHRLKAMNIDSVKDYCFYLKYDPGRGEELDELVDATTVNETYFFRENAQLEDFNNEVVPRILEQNKNSGTISIWSAGCSTGEEPYTLAMLLLEHPLRIDPSRITILGSDINRNILNAAREGLYDSYSLRHTPPLYLLKYFEKKSDGRYQVSEDVKRLVRFAHINFMDSLATGRVRDIDASFCRNVIIYFDDVDKGRCIDNLRRSLTNGGYLLLGHSESLSRSSSLLDVVRLKQTVAYRKS
jgi:chemotaxis protein methyltransferase CheR